jgi:hypothetical protein
MAGFCGRGVMKMSVRYEGAEILKIFASVSFLIRYVFYGDSSLYFMFAWCWKLLVDRIIYRVFRYLWIEWANTIAHSPDRKVFAGIICIKTSV